jgi:hypothetical protein
MSEVLGIGIEFAQKCMGWNTANIQFGTVCHSGGPSERFDPTKWESVWPHISAFLGTRYWIQMNRDRSTNHQWYIRIGVQDVSRRGASRDFIEIIDDDQTRALMEACVKAAETLKLGSV